jgi:hypothetical protein
MSNMITKPSSSQGSRIGSGLNYVTKKIVLNSNKWIKTKLRRWINGHATAEIFLNQYQKTFT